MADEPQAMTAYAVGEDAAGQRLDVFLASRDAGVSRAKIQRLVGLGAVLVNGAPGRSRDRVRAGDEVTVIWPPAPVSALAPVAMPLTILYEDAYLVVLVKPAGLAVHPGAGTTAPTLVQGLLAHCGTLGSASIADPAAWSRPGIVHRLDKDTSGVMVCAKTDKAHAALARQFHDKTTLVREYVALLDGAAFAAPVLYASYLHRDPTDRLRFASVALADFAAVARPAGYRLARTFFTREQLYGGRLTLARIRLFTGRTHQIRVHAKDLGAAVVGDLVYHRRVQLPQSFAPPVRAAVAALSRQMLHARTLGFRHPQSGAELSFEAPLPDDFSCIISMLEPYREGL